jgi:hypothetical protein
MCDITVFNDTLSVMSEIPFRNAFAAMLESAPKAYGKNYGNNFSVQGSVGITNMTSLESLVLNTQDALAFFTQCGAHDRATLVLAIDETTVPIDFLWTASGHNTLRHETRQWSVVVSGNFLLFVNVIGQAADFINISLDVALDINWNWTESTVDGPLSNTWPRESLTILTQRINSHLRQHLGTLRPLLQRGIIDMGCTIGLFEPQVPVENQYTLPCDPCDKCCNCWVQQICSNGCDGCAALVCMDDSLMTSMTVLATIFLIGAFVVGYLVFLLHR